MLDYYYLKRQKILNNLQAFCVLHKKFSTQQRESKILLFLIQLLKQQGEQLKLLQQFDLQLLKLEEHLLLIQLLKLELYGLLGIEENRVLFIQLLKLALHSLLEKLLHIYKTSLFT